MASMDSNPRVQTPLLGDGHVPTAGVWHATINILCTVIGVGMVGLPRALATSGWAGIAFIVVGGLATGYTGVQLVNLSLADPSRKRPMSTFADVGQYAGQNWSPAWGTAMKYLAVFGVLAQSFSVPVLFLILQGENLEVLFSGITAVDTMCTAEWIAVSALIITPLSWVRTMKESSYLAIFGFLSAALLGVAIVVLSLADQSTACIAPSAPTGATTFSGLANSYGVILFAWGANFVFVRIIDSMKQPTKFRMALIIAYSLTMVFYIATSVIPYTQFGENLLPQSAGNIITVMGTSPLTKVAIIGITLHVFIATVIIILPGLMYLENVMGMENAWKANKEVTERTGGSIATSLGFGTDILFKGGFIARAVFRTFVLWFLVLIAEGFQNSFSDVQALIGAVPMSLTCFILPPLYTIQNKGWKNMPWNEKIINILLIIAGTGAGVISAYYAIEGIRADIQKDGFLKIKCLDKGTHCHRHDRS